MGHEDLENKIIWQPSLSDSGYEFCVNLDREFAKKAIRTKSSDKNQRCMNNLGNNYLKSRKESHLNPYSFHEDSCFVKGIYIGHNGVWLSTNYSIVDGLLKKEDSNEEVKYHSHNIDYPSNAWTLMRLFEDWIRYFDCLKESK